MGVMEEGMRYAEGERGRMKEGEGRKRRGLRRGAVCWCWEDGDIEMGSRKTQVE
jgi:hypothetical protein